MWTQVSDAICHQYTVYPKKYAHGFCFAVLCCGYTLTDFPISIRLTSLALWQSNDCPSASKASLMNMDKYFMWIHYERLHNHNKAKHNKTVCIFLGIYCSIEHNEFREVHYVYHRLLSFVSEVFVALGNSARLMTLQDVSSLHNSVLMRYPWYNLHHWRPFDYAQHR